MIYLLRKISRAVTTVKVRDGSDLSIGVRLVLNRVAYLIRVDEKLLRRVRKCSGSPILSMDRV